MFFVWLVIFGLVTMLSQHFAALTPWAVPAGLLINICTLLLCSRKQKPFGFRKLTLAQGKMHLFFLPYLLPILYHLIRFGFSPPSFSGILVIFLAAVLEELVFRGIFLRYCCRWGCAWGIFLSALAFSTAHLLGGFDPTQLIFAFSVGLAFGAIALDSLLPCMVIHFLINLTANPTSGYAPLTDWLFWLCVAVYLACGIYHLMKRCSHETVH